MHNNQVIQFYIKNMFQRTWVVSKVQCLCWSPCWAGWHHNCSRSRAGAADQGRCHRLWRGWWPSLQKSLPHPKWVGMTVIPLLFTGWSDLVNINPVKFLLSHAPPKSLFHLSLMHKHTETNRLFFCIWIWWFRIYQDFFFSVRDMWPNNLQLHGTEISCLWCSSAQRDEEERGREVRRRGERGRRGWCGVCSAKRDTPATFLNITSLLGKPWLHQHEQQTACWGFTSTQLYFDFYLRKKLWCHVTEFRFFSPPAPQ